MDAIKILGGLLGNRSQSGGGLGRILLEQVLSQSQNNQQHQQQHQQQRAVEQARQQQEARRQAQHQRAHQAEQQNHGGLQSVLRDIFGRNTQKATPARQQPVQHQQDHHHDHGYDDQQLNERAVVLIRAMINAAKADGSIDQKEQDGIVSRLEPLSPEETQFLRDEFRRPLNVHDFAHSVPRGMEQEVYSVSLMAIDLDTNPEAKYLRELAECLRIDPQMCNDIHHHYSAPQLYR